MKIVISLPAYDEEDSLGQTLDDIKNIMDKTDYNYKLQVIDDGSTDKTVSVAKEHGAIVYSNKRNIGLAKTFKEEIKYAGDFDIFVHLDSDNQYDASFIPQLIEEAKINDLVIGSRFMNTNEYSGSFIKNIGNRIFSFTISKLIKQKITDVTSGFRAFNQDIAQLPITNDFTYTYENIIRTKRKGYKIVEIPVTTNKTRPSKLFKNPLDYAIKAWINILRVFRDFAPLYFFGKIGLTFILLGCLLGLFIILNVLITGRAGGIPRVILSMLLISMGIQIGLFGFLADMNRK